MIKLSIWTNKKLKAANDTVNQRLAEGWQVVNVSAMEDNQYALVALYRDYR
jgi:hypothetical protein